MPAGTSMLRKRCTGAHCGWRDHCAHHVLPTTDTRALIYPVKTAEFCDHYEKKQPGRWGDGPDPAGGD